MVLVLGSASSEWLVVDICKAVQLEHLTVATEVSDLKKKMDKAFEVLKTDHSSYLPDILEIITLQELEKYRRPAKKLALCFDVPLCNDAITRWSFLRPDYVYGIAHRDAINPFAIWESFHQCAHEIHIISWKVKEDVLHWERRTGSDIELSVIFPVYNVANYLKTCLDSISHWDASYVEYLFVDDGSPDNSAEIITEYAEKDPRIKLLQKENGGCASARQYGMERAKGQYIGFIDPDDYIDPSMFRKLLSAAMSGSYEIAYCGYNELYENSGATREIPDSLGDPYVDGTADIAKINALISNLRVAIWRGIYARDLIERNHIHFYTDLRRFDDLPFKVEVLSKARSVVAVPEYLYYYRLARPGQDVSADDERLYVHFPIFKYLDDFLRRSSDQRQLDYLQLVKVHTHKFALCKLRSEFIKEYVRQASEDIRSNFGYREGRYILRKLSGRGDRLWFFALYFRQVPLIKWLISREK